MGSRNRNKKEDRFFAMASHSGVNVTVFMSPCQGRPWGWGGRLSKKGVTLGDIVVLRDWQLGPDGFPLKNNQVLNTYTWSAQTYGENQTMGIGSAGTYEKAAYLGARFLAEYLHRPAPPPARVFAAAEDIMAEIARREAA